MNNSTTSVPSLIIGHGNNYGRVEQRISLDLALNGLGTALFQNFNSDIEHPIVCRLDDPALPKEYSAAWCKERSQELLDFVAEDFGKDAAGKQKMKSVLVTLPAVEGSTESTTIKVTVDPEKLVIPESTVIEYVFMTGNRRGHTLHCKALTEGLQDEVMQVRVLPFEEAKAIAERENLQKMVGFKGLSKLDKYVMVRDRIKLGTVTEESDLYNKLDISRADAQAIYGPALKGRQSVPFHKTVMAGKIQLTTEIKDKDTGKVIDSINHTCGLDRFSNKAGTACKKANTIEAIKVEVGAVIKPKGVKAANAVSGADMRKMAENACPVLKAFLTALSTGQSEEAKQLMVTLSDIEIEFGDKVEA